MEEYRHGVRVEEEGSYVAEPENGTAGLQVIFGTAPVNLAVKPEAAVNTPVVCRTMKDAEEKLGYCNDYKKYTLCQSMFACFRAFAVAPVVFVNVLDPAKHKKGAGGMIPCRIHHGNDLPHQLFLQLLEFLFLRIQPALAL